MCNTKAGEKTSLIVFACSHMLILLGAVGLSKLFFDFSSNFVSFVLSLILYIVFANLPVFLYVGIRDKSNIFSFFKLREKAIKGILIGLVIGLFISAIFFAVNRFKFSESINIRRDVWLIIGTALVGMLEEIPFRGFYLQKLERHTGFLVANIISSVMFALLHVVMLLGSGGNVTMQLVLLFVISLWFGYIFKRTNSLWAVAIAHAIYNLAIYFL